MIRKPLFIIYSLLLILYSIWSFALTDRNLQLLSFSPFVTFQSFMWSMTSVTSTILFIVLIVSLFFVYAFLIQNKEMQHNFLTNKKVLLLFTISLIALTFSSNALSHDIFNYIFNAKMVLVYNVDPHVHIALEFFEDLWLRFMHNVHTPAPYFYGWTALSLIPALIGFNKFFLIWSSFKLWNAIGLGILFFAQTKLLHHIKVKEQWKILLFILNPLVLIESVSNSHNDVWMMAFVFISFLFLEFWLPTIKKSKVILSLAFLLLSISIKYVTVVLLPIWLLLFMKKRGRGIIKIHNPHPIFFAIRQFPFDTAVILLLIPLFSPRSQWFHPWYLIWSLSFLPFVEQKRLQAILIGFSFSSLLRYIPWLWHGGFEYTDQIQLQQRVITWGLGVLFSICWFNWHQRRYTSKILA